jgi:ribonucleoside-triphosphate reductase
MPSEVYTRVVGYLRPVQNFNKGKKAEYSDRVKYVIKEQSLPLDAEGENA